MTSRRPMLTKQGRAVPYRVRVCCAFLLDFFSLFPFPFLEFFFPLLGGIASFRARQLFKSDHTLHSYTYLLFCDSIGQYPWLLPSSSSSFSSTVQHLWKHFGWRPFLALLLSCHVQNGRRNRPPKSLSISTYTTRSSAVLRKMGCDVKRNEYKQLVNTKQLGCWRSRASSFLNLYTERWSSVDGRLIKFQVANVTPFYSKVAKVRILLAVSNGRDSARSLFQTGFWKRKFFFPPTIWNFFIWVWFEYQRVRSTSFSS